MKTTLQQTRKAWAGGGAAGTLAVTALGVILYSLARRNGVEISQEEALAAAGLIALAGSAIGGVVAAVVYRVPNLVDTVTVIRQIGRQVWGVELTEAQIIEVINSIERLLNDRGFEP